MTARLLMIHAYSSLHPGTGQSIGAIDLAIARERSTGIPYLPGSSIKGVLRDVVRDGDGDGKVVQEIFGPDTDHAADHAGSVHFGDGRLVVMPIRSLAGTFGYVTSPYLVDRLRRDAAEVGPKLSACPEVKHIEKVLVATDSSLTIKEKVVFEDLDFDRIEAEPVKKLGEDLARWIGLENEAARAFVKRFCVVHDDAMAYLMEQCTELQARIRIDDDTGTVAKGALWYEESLPAETVLCSLVKAMPPSRIKTEPDKMLDTIEACLGPLIQFGGMATVGRGRCRVRMQGGEG